MAPAAGGRHADANASGADEDHAPPAVLSDEEKLKIFIQINLRRAVMTDYRKLFQSRRGRTYAPNFGIRGISKNYAEVVDAINVYLSLSAESQNEANKKYKDDTTNNIKKKHKEMCMNLNTDRERLRAIKNFGDRGLVIADELGYCTAGIEDITDEEEDAVVPHMGLASNDENLGTFHRERENRYSDRGRKKPRRSDESTCAKHLSRKVHSDSFFSAATYVAKANDATYLDAQKHPAAPLRTIIMISVNECTDVSEAGGKVPTNNRRAKTKVSILADSAPKFEKVMKIITDAVGRTSSSNPHKYEIEEIVRTENGNLLSVVNDHKNAFKEKRRCPKRKRASEESILSDITNMNGEDA